MSGHELEQVFAAAREVNVPTGCYVGEHLGWIDAPDASALWRPVLSFGFARLPFGIDFDRRRWFFVDRRLLIGRFEAEVGPSRWRPTDSVRLTYHRSRLPRLVRSSLYDEVKPLSEDVCLGMGGINAERGAGDHFFFALRRVE